MRSIVGRFLEHTRIWYFANDGADEVWLASADWMGRNLFRRIEVAFPVLDPELKARVIAEGLKPYLADNRDAWELAGDGTYERPKAVAPVAAARRAAGARRSACRSAPDRRTTLDHGGRIMDLILWRHAEAEPGEPDLGRRLTAKGIQQAERDGEMARSAPSGHDAHPVESRRSRGADRACAEAQISRRARTRAGRVGGRGSRGGGMAGRARARPRRRPSADAGGSRRLSC